MSVHLCKTPGKGTGNELTFKCTAELCQAMSEKLFKNNRNGKNAMCKDRERLGLLFVKVHLQLTFKLLSQMEVTV